MEQPARLLIAEDQPLILAGLKHILGTTAKFDIIAHVTTLLQAYRLCQEHQPDVLIISLNLLPSPTSPTLNDLQQNYPKLKLLLMGGDCNDDCLLDLLNAGVSGFVLKSDPTEAIHTALYAITQGGNYFSHAALTSLTQGRREMISQADLLTNREVQIVHLLMKGMDNRLIANELGLAYQTVRNRLRTIYKKLGVQSRSEAIVWATNNKLMGRH